jgi:hypothetical protein
VTDRDADAVTEATAVEDAVFPDAVVSGVTDGDAEGLLDGVTESVRDIDCDVDAAVMASVSDMLDVCDGEEERDDDCDFVQDFVELFVMLDVIKDDAESPLTVTSRDDDGETVNVGEPVTLAALVLDVVSEVVIDVLTVNEDVAVGSMDGVFDGDVDHESVSLADKVFDVDWESLGDADTSVECVCDGLGPERVTETTFELLDDGENVGENDVVILRLDVTDRRLPDNENDWEPLGESDADVSGEGVMECVWLDLLCSVGDGVTRWLGVGGGEGVGVGVIEYDVEALPDRDRAAEGVRLCDATPPASLALVKLLDRVTDVVTLSSREYVEDGVSLKEMLEVDDLELLLDDVRDHESLTDGDASSVWETSDGVISCVGDGDHVIDCVAECDPDALVVGLTSAEPLRVVDGPLLDCDRAGVKECVNVCDAVRLVSIVGEGDNVGDWVAETVKDGSVVEVADGVLPLDETLIETLRSADGVGVKECVRETLDDKEKLSECAGDSDCDGEDDMDSVGLVSDVWERVIDIWDVTDKLLVAESDAVWLALNDTSCVCEGLAVKDHDKDLVGEADRGILMEKLGVPRVTDALGVREALAVTEDEPVVLPLREISPLCVTVRVYDFWGDSVRDGDEISEKLGVIVEDIERPDVGDGVDVGDDVFDTEILVDSVTSLVFEGLTVDVWVGLNESEIEADTDMSEVMLGETLHEDEADGVSIAVVDVLCDREGVPDDDAAEEIECDFECVAVIAGWIDSVGDVDDDLVLDCSILTDGKVRVNDGDMDRVGEAEFSSVGEALGESSGVFEEVGVSSLVVEAVWDDVSVTVGDVVNDLDGEEVGEELDDSDGDVVMLPEWDCASVPEAELELDIVTDDVIDAAEEYELLREKLSVALGSSDEDPEGEWEADSTSVADSVTVGGLLGV